MITEDYCDFETAKLLKEKGFDGECRTYFKVFPAERIAAIYHSSEKRTVSEDDPNEILCPTQQMVMRWLREVHHLHISVQPYIELPDNGEKVDTDNFYHWDFYVMLPSGEYPKCKRYNDFQTYEDAAKEAIKYCIEKLI